MLKLQPTKMTLALAAAFSVSAAQAADNAPEALNTTPTTQGQTHVTADHMDGQMQDKLKASGDVVVIRDNQTLEADWLDYYQQQNRVKAGNHFRLTRDKDVVTGTTLDYWMDEHTGSAQQPSFQMGSPDTNNKPGGAKRSLAQSGIAFRGDGSEAQFTGPDQYRLINSRVNSCVVGDDSWYLKSSTLDLNYATNIGVARNARLEFQGVPILYTPWIDFPLDGSRKSGLLTPTFRSGTTGFDIALPYYWNIAPNFDATFTPHINLKRGTMLAGEFRYLEPDYEGSIYTEQLRNDKLTHTNRYAWYATHKQNLLPGLTFGYDYNYVSDTKYFDDFGDRTLQAINVNLLRQAWTKYNTNWQGGNLEAMLRVQRYQTLEDPLIPADQPYARLPQLTLVANQQLPSGFSFNLQGDLTRFSHPTLQTGDRFVAYPSVTWNLLDKSWGFFRPKFGVNYTKYDLNPLSNNTTPGSTITRTLPIFSTDSGLHFERDTSFNGSNYVETLEPRLFYVYIPAKDQSKIPNFDSSENDFNFAQLFSENRFSSWDRINAANQLTAALTSRLISAETGIERLRLMLGQRYYFRNEDTSLYGNQITLQNNSKGLLGSLGGDLDQAWRLDSTYEYNQDLAKTQRYNLQVRYNPAPGKTVSLRYRYGRYDQIGDTTQYGPLRMVDLGVQWPIVRQWYAVGRESYSLIDSKPLEHLLGVEYNDGCWTARVVVKRTNTLATTISSASKSTGIFFQLELRGLGSLGSSPTSDLKLAIPGYSNISDIRSN
ncbi:LPS-assembly protein LptD [Aquitalea sp. USM4]|uniref:LPS-assembly protein LptD n=1 Tax=Aquitalea sp. USM4 TaxID=1590041 RepID=UPI00103A9A04|nr:LPS-assembly protein LptD [Aquitalea sp. USM4]QBJ77656.1 LPS-assembly protein LptD [Aquitalea sp. USM4]